MKATNLRRELPGVGDCTIRVATNGVTVQRGRRSVTLDWDSFWRYADAPANAPAKVLGSVEGKRGWVRDGRKQNAARSGDG